MGAAYFNRVVVIYVKVALSVCDRGWSGYRMVTSPRGPDDWCISLVLFGCLILHVDDASRGAKGCRRRAGQSFCVKVPLSVCVRVTEVGLDIEWSRLRVVLMTGVSR